MAIQTKKAAPEHDAAFADKRWLLATSTIQKEPFQVFYPIR